MVLVGSLVSISMFYDIEGVFGGVEKPNLIKVFDIQLESPYLEVDLLAEVNPFISPKLGVRCHLNSP